MAKHQSALRNAVDAVFAPSQYLTSDGAAYAQNKYVQMFNRVSKVPYMVFASGVALETMAGMPSGMAMNAFGIGMLVLMDTGFGFGRYSLKDIYFDTKAENRCFVEPTQATALKMQKIYGLLSVGIASVAGGYCAGADIVSGNPVHELPFMFAYASWGFGNYWRSKQVLDGNWTLMDKAPPEKPASKASETIPDNAIPNRCEIAPALAL